MTPFLASLALASLSLPLEERAVGAEPVALQARAQPRLRAGLGVGAMGGRASWAFGGGPGLTGELGVVLGDRLSLTARAWFGTLFVVSAGTLGFSADYALSDRVSVGLGGAVALVGGLWVLDLPEGAAVLLPLRVCVAPFPRSGAQVRRAGLLLTAELAPGATFSASGGYLPGASPRPPNPGFAITAMLGVSYALW